MPYQGHRWEVGQLHHSIMISTNLSLDGQDNDVQNFITLRQDIRSLSDDHTFVFIPVYGYFIAYYISSGLDSDPQAADFHCARLHILEQVDGDLLCIRFPLTIL